MGFPVDFPMSHAFSRGFSSRLVAPAPKDLWAAAAPRAAAAARHGLRGGAAAAAGGAGDLRRGADGSETGALVLPGWLWKIMVDDAHLYSYNYI